MQHDFSESWYVLTNWDGTVTETESKEDAKFALREGREVTKNTRRIFEIGAATVRLAVSIEVKKVKHL